MMEDGRQELSGLPGRNVLSFQGLGEVLPSRFRYMPNPGNLGDCLIAHGTYTFFEAHGFEFQDRDSDTLVYAGGGNFVESYYNQGYRVLKKHLRKGGRACILPHTIDGYYDFFLQYREQLTLVCRERVSCQRLLASGFPGERVFLCDDMALFLGERGLAAHYNFESPLGALLVLRDDVEKNAEYESGRAIDLTGTYSYLGNDGIGEVEAASKALLLMLSLYDTVVTDRLHVSIACALLGRKCYLVGNAYFKNRAVFEYSLKDRFAHVHFVDSITEVPGQVLAQAEEGVDPNALFPDISRIRDSFDWLHRRKRRLMVLKALSCVVPSRKLRKRIRDL